MKRILASLAIVGLLATSAHAVGRYSYNPTSFSPIRIIGQWAIGNQRVALTTTDNWRQNGPCWEKVFTVYSVWYNHFTHETTVQIDGQVVTQTVCP